MTESAATIRNPPWTVSPNPEIDVDKFLEILKDIGLKGHVKRTGHHDYKRVFVINKKGVTLGRATIYCGFYSHTKWYGEKFIGGHYVKESVLLEARLDAGRAATDEEYKAAAKRSRERAQLKYEEKLRWREEHPRPNGKPRKRLERPNYHDGISCYLLVEMGVKDEQYLVEMGLEQK